MPTRIAINGFGRIGRGVVRAAIERGADIEIVAVNDVADPATLAHLLAHDSVYGRFAARPSTCDGRRDRRRRPRDPRARRARSRRAAVGRARRRRRHRVHRALPHPRRGRRAPRGRRAQGHPLRPGQGRRAGRREPRAGRELRRGLRPGAPPHRHERVVHDQLPRAGREGAPRDRRHPARPHDHGPRLHRRPEPARRPAQGPAPRARGGDQPRPDLDRRGEGARAGHPGARRAAQRLRRPRARSRRARSSTSPIEAERATTVGGGQRRLRRARRRPGRWPASSPTARSRSSRPTSSARRTRRSSTRR